MLIGALALGAAAAVTGAAGVPVTEDHGMSAMLSNAQEELVAIGAAVASNCEPCLRHHLGKAREAGLGDAQLRAAVDIARMVKETPARFILEAADRLLAAGEAAPGEVSVSAPAKDRCCG